MLLLTSYIVFSLGAGYMAGVQPSGAGWRDFSWHPFLMTCAFVGAFGAAAVTKKRGGYTNTKAHGILAWLGNFLALGMYRRELCVSKESNLVLLMKCAIS